MATGHWYSCGSCGWESGPSSMFQGLRDLADSGPPSCDSCRATASYVFEFEPGLESGGAENEAVAAFLPDGREKWKKRNGDLVEFFPFLVILKERDQEDLFHWLPYWHVVKSKRGVETKYGQWAPMIRRRQFESMIRKAHEKGFISTASTRPGKR